MEIGLVSCVQTKQDVATQPRDLYISDYFQKMRSYAEAHHDDWFILSAKHGLLEPGGEPIEPYDDTLRTATKAEKQAWAKRVANELEEKGVLREEVTLVIHAGKDYYEELIPVLGGTVNVEIPTEGLRIGEKKAWYNAHQ